MPKSKRIDNSPGEIKLVRGSGPPMLTVEGDTIEIAQQLWILTPSHYRQQMPVRGTVIGIDLTKRIVRLQTQVGQEILYSPERDNHHSESWVFSTTELAKQNAIKLFQQNVEYATRQADKALDGLEEAKKSLHKAKTWNPDTDADVFVEAGQ